MSFMELLFLEIVLYYIIFLICYTLMDCNILLWYKARYGLPVSVMRGRVVWITGASSGIGRALALNLARNGVRLILSARRNDLLEELRTDCLNLSRGSLTAKDVLALPMDMLHIDSQETHFKAVLESFGQLDVLVNNAGRSQRASWESIDVQVDRELFELDVFSVMNLSRLVVRYFMAERNGRGHIACTSSVAGFAPVPYSATYVAAKSALNSYMLALMVEHPKVDATIFAPGPVHTEFLEEAFTAQPGSKVGASTKRQKRMTAERCGQLYAVALANKLKIAWCGLFPVNFLVLVCRDPLLSFIAYSMKSSSWMNKIREGRI